MKWRGPWAGELLRRCGIDPKRYWLLADLFHELSERGEMLDQLGRNGLALKTVAWFYAAMSVIIAIFLLVAQPGEALYLGTFLGLTAFLLFSVLLSETSNSLINPVEGLVLAHQPIDGATYTAAKLSHLFRILLYFVPALDGPPALLGLFLKDARWFYPLVHFVAAFAVGIVASLACCAMFGWLIRFVPVKRLKATGQLIGSLPFLGMAWMGPIEKAIRRLGLRIHLPQSPAIRWMIGISLALVASAGVVFGLRSLSADFLIRVSSMVRGGPTAGSKPRRSMTREIVGRWFGGQPARAGAAFVSRMMFRDWQFRRQLVSLAFPAVIGVGSIVSGLAQDPFAREFSRMHLVPNIPGVCLFLICSIIPYGSDYKGSWVLRLAPSRAMDGFARGVHALLWLTMIVYPLVVLLPVFAWRWGLWHAALFVAYSMAAGSVYLALDLKMIHGAPFTMQMDSSRGYTAMPIMMIGGLAVAAAVGIQWFVIFRWPAAVLGASVVLAAIAYFLTRASVKSLAGTIRYQLDLDYDAVGALYKEV